MPQPHNQFTHRLASLCDARLSFPIAKWMMIAAVATLWIGGFDAAAAEKDKHWSTSVEASVSLAQEQGKHHLFYFGGSDWCPPCFLLQERVFSQPTFYEWAQPRLVLTELDLPRTTPIDPQLRIQNQTWYSKLGLDTFPSLVLLDTQARPYHVTSGIPVEVDTKWLAARFELAMKLGEQFESHMDLAQQSEGADKAYAMDRALSLVDEIFYPYYRQQITTLLQAASPDQQTITQRWEPVHRQIVLTDRLADAILAAHEGKLEESLAILDQTIEQYELVEGKEYQQFLAFKANVLVQLERYTETLLTMQAAIDAAPRTKLAAALEDFKQEIMAVQVPEVGEAQTP